MALLSVKDACISYGGTRLLDHIDLNIERNERVCLLGRNGSGKTTLMKLINGEIVPDSGAVSRSQGVATARLDQEIPSGITGPVFDIVTSGLAAQGRLLADYHHASALLADQNGDDPKLMARLARLGQQLDAENGWGMGNPPPGRRDPIQDAAAGRSRVRDLVHRVEAAHSAGPGAGGGTRHFNVGRAYQSSGYRRHHLAGGLSRRLRS